MLWTTKRRLGARAHSGRTRGVTAREPLLALLLVAAALLAAGSTACRGQRDTAVGGGHGVASASASARPAPPASGATDLRADAPPKPGFEPDELWKDAAAGDPIDRARLAEGEGAVGLLAGVEAGGRFALTALDALPHARDGEVALRRLCEILSKVAAEHRTPFLRSVHGIVNRPPLGRERLDVEGMRSCRKPLREVQHADDATPKQKDLAASALVMLGEHARPQNRDAATP